MPEAELTREERLRRVIILCCNCLRNLAYYRAGWDQGGPLFDDTITLERTINGNFLDMAVLEWCKLFKRGEQHSWHEIVADPDEFRRELWAALHVDEAGYTEIWNEVTTYRDKFLAHLDGHRYMRLPVMDNVKASVMYYYSYLHRTDGEGIVGHDDLPSDLDAYYQQRSCEARQRYLRDG